MRPVLEEMDLEPAIFPNPDLRDAERELEFELVDASTAQGGFNHQVRCFIALGEDVDSTGSPPRLPARRNVAEPSVWKKILFLRQYSSIMRPMFLLIDSCRQDGDTISS